MKTSSSGNKYAARAIIDYGVRRSAEMVETRLRREVLQGLESVIVDNVNYAIKMHREVMPLPDIGENRGMVSEVTYWAEITEVQEREVEFPVRYYEPWKREPLPYPSKGRNHRKKDRARARYRKAQRKKLRIQAYDRATHNTIHHITPFTRDNINNLEIALNADNLEVRKGREREQTTEEKGI